ncbi:MAG: alcohol dehydrogenase catalytic domain-containing protein [Candidatus Sumerlaeota bacterium]|nr:alcohol dehydrogenase catalytic domain-containing protein [Candidatus Sumerlaeota bacterium]
MTSLPKTQYAVQLTGPSTLEINTSKPVIPPTGYQILGKVEATGLCFSDLKLLKQFAEHPRKGHVAEGIALEELKRIPSYVPGDMPTVPGHETVIRIVAVGDKVKKHKAGERRLVQTDYRGLKIPGGSNASFGYNFEGGLQEYVLIDERISRDMQTDESFLLPVREEKSRSAICLAEPWACVENSYATVERQTLKAGGQLLIVADEEHSVGGIEEAFAEKGAPASVTYLCATNTQAAIIRAMDIPSERAKFASALPDKHFDDIIYFGANKATIEILSGKIANQGIVNIVTAGQKIGVPAAIGVGRIHYGLTRWIGTNSASAADAYSVIPHTGEIRENDRCLVMGAAGPMGQMHVVRNICSGKSGVKVVATDLDDVRLASLARVAVPMAKANGIDLRVINTKTTLLSEKFTYVAVMVPVPALVGQAIADADEGCLINVFAGIPAPTIHPIDLDALIAKRCFLFGTSGSVLNDMKIMLKKVEDGTLDTNVSVDAVSGMAGAIDGIAAVENRTLAGKIIVYPELHDLPLTPLAKLGEKFPTVAAKLDEGRWTKAAEEELLRMA